MNTSSASTEGAALAGTGALVTGGAGGLGSACAEWLLRDGASVVLMGRTRDTLRETAERLADVGDAHEAAVSYVVGDATVETDVIDAVETVVDRHGSLDICVATVGGGSMAPLLAFDTDRFEDDLRRNVVPSFLAIKHSAPRMAAAGGGSIVCISSDAGAMSWPYMAGYCAGKAGLEGLVKVAADELGHLDVRVNAVRPGLVRTTSRNSEQLFADDELIAEFERQKPLGRTGVPADVAAGVRFLAGPESGWVTGQSLAIEGGNELRRAPSLEPIVRARLGDDVVDRALAGKPPRDRDGAGAGGR